MTIKLNDLQVQSYILFRPETTILHHSDLSFFTVTLERRSQSDGSSKWGIFKNGNVLSKADYDFIYERFPSQRTDESLKDTRFDTPEEAIEFWEKNTLPNHLNNLNESIKALQERKKKKNLKS